MESRWWFLRKIESGDCNRSDHWHQQRFASFVCLPIQLKVVCTVQKLKKNLLQTLLRYPANSFKPSGPIVGGTGFYAAPLDLSSANQISFSFQIFFPNDFQWVLGGKLPGLYGGRTQCSGGDPAIDCFSTRKMVRNDHRLHSRLNRQRLTHTIVAGKRKGGSVHLRR